MVSVGETSHQSIKLEDLAEGWWMKRYCAASFRFRHVDNHELQRVFPNHAQRVMLLQTRKVDGFVQEVNLLFMLNQHFLAMA